MIEIRLERKLLPNLLLDISVSVSPRRTVRKLKVGRWSDNQEHFLGAAKNTSDWNIARIAKAALHKFPGKSSLNVNFVYLDCPVCPVCLVCLVCLVYPVSPDIYDSIASVGKTGVWWRADFQSGSRVLKKVFWTFSYLYLWHTMWCHTEKLLKTPKFWKSLNFPDFFSVLSPLSLQMQQGHVSCLNMIGSWTETKPWPTTEPRSGARSELCANQGGLWFENWDQIKKGGSGDF